MAFERLTSIQCGSEITTNLEPRLLAELHRHNLHEPIGDELAHMLGLSPTWGEWRIEVVEYSSIPGVGSYIKVKVVGRGGPFA